MKNRNARFKKKTLGSHCWYCDKKSDGIMFFINGDEIPVCVPCFKKNVKFIRKSKSKLKQPKIFAKNAEKIKQHGIKQPQLLSKWLK